jgi:type VI secretion system protein ImpK
MAFQGQWVERRANLAMAFQELFTAIGRLRFNRSNVSNGEEFRAQVKKALGIAMQEAMAAGYPHDDVQVAAYVVVAFVDESVLSLNSPVFANWEGNPLQVEIFKQFLAGEWFYGFVDQLLRRPDSTQTADILEVFYLCIVLGYLGRYASTKGELGSTMTSIWEKISLIRGKSLLSPQALLPLDAPQAEQVNPWSKRLVVAAIAAFALSIVIFMVCKIVLVGGSSTIHSLAGQ